jgi:hypothetical protein
MANVGSSLLAVARKFLGSWRPSGAPVDWRPAFSLFTLHHGETMRTIRLTLQLGELRPIVAETPDEIREAIAQR